MRLPALLIAGIFVLTGILAPADANPPVKSGGAKPAAPPRQVAPARPVTPPPQRPVAQPPRPVAPPKQQPATKPPAMHQPKGSKEVVAKSRTVGKPNANKTTLSKSQTAESKTTSAFHHKNTTNRHIRRHTFLYTVTYRAVGRYSRLFDDYNQAYDFYVSTNRMYLYPRITQVDTSAWRVTYGRSSWHHYFRTLHHHAAFSAYHRLRAMGLHAHIYTRRLY